MGCETNTDSLFKRQIFQSLAMLPDTKKKTFMSKNSPMRLNEKSFNKMIYQLTTKNGAKNEAPL